MKQNYFVCIQHNTIADNLNKIQAINLAVNEHNKNPNLGGIEIGIGRYKYINEKCLYTMLPYFFYL